jgi:hypothetical protein
MFCKQDCFGLLVLNNILFHLACQPPKGDFGSSDLRQHECDDGARRGSQTSEWKQHLDGLCKCKHVECVFVPKLKT